MMAAISVLIEHAPTLAQVEVLAVMINALRGSTEYNTQSNRRESLGKKKKYELMWKRSGKLSMLSSL